MKVAVSHYCQKMVTSTGLWSVFVFLCIGLPFAIAQKGTFVIEENKRIAFRSYEKAVTNSIVDCSRVCHFSVNCTGANYRAETRTCYLFNQTCFATENAPGWTYLRRTQTIQGERTFQYMPNKRETWDGAKQYCESIGGRLAHILTQDDQEKILRILSQYTSPTVWLGGSDRDSEGEWVWSNGLRFDDQDFNFWASKQPNNLASNQHCLELRKLYVNGLEWNDWDCDVYQTFVCEIWVA